MIYGLLRKALFRMPPELAHQATLDMLRAGHRLGANRWIGRRVSDPTTVMGLEFPNRVGLAAGADKNGEAVDGFGDLGFGFIEVGTVTPRPQPGNPKPRVFRLTEHEALINRLGFNNHGVDRLVEAVAERSFDGVLGINIGKNFDTPVERAADDYETCLQRVYPHADYVTINISSPNTEGLRGLQERKPLEALVRRLTECRARLADRYARCVPLVVKVAPDIDDDAVPELAEVLHQARIDGVIATNTTLSRAAVQGHRHADEAGGLSGAPLRSRANQVLALLREALPEEIALIGVGGITCGEDAAEKVRLGADLVQFYTGFVYRGPDLIGECVNAMRDARRAP